MNTEQKTELTSYDLAREKINQIIERLKISHLISDPFVDMREDKESYPMIGFVVTINNKNFNYSMGIGHVKWIYNNIIRWKFKNGYLIENIIGAMRNGKTIKKEYYPELAAIAVELAKMQKVKPLIGDVLGCLCRETLDCDCCFEEWAQNYGYDTDSRRAERNYYLCRDNANKIRSFLKQSEINEIAELANEL